MAPPDVSAMSNVRFGEFENGADEAAFLHKHVDRVTRELTRSLCFCSLFYVAFALSDIADIGYGARTQTLLAARLSVAAIALVGILMLRHSSHRTRTANRVATFVTTAGMGTFLLIVSYRPADVLLHGMSMAIMLIIVYLFIPNRVITATTVALVASAAFLVLVYVLGTAGSDRMISMTMLLILANLFGGAAALRNAELWREQFSIQQMLTNLSVRDPLTGTFNRRHLNAGLLDDEIARSARYRKSLALVMCDIDCFKNVNDTHGHLAGDALLRQFGEMMQSMTRAGVDTVVRYGGEEFLLILPDTTLNDGEILAKRMRAAFSEKRCIFGDIEIASTASFGVVAVDFSKAITEATANNLIARADELMYCAKQGGRNRVISGPLNVCR